MAEQSSRSSEEKAEKTERRKDTKAQPSLDQGLYQAQVSLTAVAKDKRNEFSKYNYVSVDGMVSACRDALHDQGIMAARVKFEIDRETGVVTNHFQLTCAATGETRVYITPWLFFEEKGKPIDKALAGALSSSLNYFLRDLLLVVREEEGNMDRRNDKDYEPKRKPDVFPAAAPQDIAALREDLRKLAALKGPVWLSRVLERCAGELQREVNSLADITDGQVVRIINAHTGARS
jgi:hypothetical protein